MSEVKIHQGRVVIPAPLRAALGLRDGDTVRCELRDGELVISTRRARLERAKTRFQELFQAEDGRSWVDELIQERRGEAAREDD